MRSRLALLEPAIRRQILLFLAQQPLLRLGDLRPRPISRLL
jgi:hypothetical protein